MFSCEAALPLIIDACSFLCAFLFLKFECKLLGFRRLLEVTKGGGAQGDGEAGHGCGCGDARVGKHHESCSRDDKRHCLESLAHIGD